MSSIVVGVQIECNVLYFRSIFFAAAVVAAVDVVIVAAVIVVVSIWVHWQESRFVG